MSSVVVESKKKTKKLPGQKLGERKPTTHRRISDLAGLSFPPSRFGSFFAGRKAGKKARIVFAGAVESAIVSILETVREQEGEKKRASLGSIRAALSSSDHGIQRLIGPSFISQGGWDKTDYFGVGKMRRTKHAEKTI